MTRDDVPQMCHTGEWEQRKSRLVRRLSSANVDQSLLPTRVTRGFNFVTSPAAMSAEHPSKGPASRTPNASINR